MVGTQIELPFNMYLLVAWANYCAVQLVKIFTAIYMGLCTSLTYYQLHLNVECA